MARRVVTARAWPAMQIIFETGMTSDEYVSERGWERATLDSCPVHADGDCGLRAHGSCARKHPTGLRIARWYCASGQVTFSLLPEFLAAGFSGTLPELEAAVTLSERASSINEAARQLRPELNDERTAVRWLRRRLSAIGQGLTVLATSLPGLWGTMPTLSAVGAKLGAASGAILTTLRRTALSLLGALPAPLGLRHRRTAVRNSAEALQHTVGPVRG